MSVSMSPFVFKAEPLLESGRPEGLALNVLSYTTLLFILLS